VGDDSAWPNLLLIGANRAGTTSLFRELARHPDIFAGRTKETALLTRPLRELKQNKNRLKKYFEGSRHHRYVLDASTQYSMLPRHKGVPEKAVELFGDDIKVVYSVRNPVDRTVSQVAQENIPWEEHTVDDVVAAATDGVEDRFYDPYLHSLYDWQLEQWLQVLPHRNIFVLVAEEWQRERARSVERLSAFLDMDLEACLKWPPLRENAVEELAEMPAAAHRFIKSDFYKLRVKKRVPRRVIDLTKKALPRRQRATSAGLADAVATSMKPRFQHMTSQLIDMGVVEASTIARFWGDDYVVAGR
jgi:hypothetical protein